MINIINDNVKLRSRIGQSIQHQMEENIFTIKLQKLQHGKNQPS